MAKNKEDNNVPDRPLHEIETKCTTCHRRLEQNGEILISEYRRCQTCHLRTCSDCAYVISNIEWLCAKPRCHVLYESRRGEKISDINPSTKSKNENDHRDDSHTKPVPLALDRDRKTDRRGSLNADCLPKSEHPLPEDSNGASTPAIKGQANGPTHHNNGNSTRCIIDHQTIPSSHAGVRPKQPIPFSTPQHAKKSYKVDEYFIEHSQSVVPRSRRSSDESKVDDHISNHAENDGKRERCSDHTISRPHKRTQSCELDSRSLQREIPLKYSHKEYGSSSPHRERGQFNGRRDSQERSFSYHPNDLKHTHQQGSNRSRQLEWKNNARERDPEYYPNQRSGNPSIEVLNEAEFDRKRILKEKESNHHRSDARASLATSDRPKERSIHRGSSEEYSSNGKRQSSSQSRSDSSRSSSEHKRTSKDKSVDFNLYEEKHTSEKYHQQHRSFQNPDDRSMSKHRQNGSSYMNGHDRSSYRSKPNEMNRKQRESLIEYHQSNSKSNHPIYNERSHSDEFETQRLRSSVYYASENGLSAHHKERSKSSELERRRYLHETPLDVSERDKNGKHVRYYQERSSSVQSANRGISSNFLSVDDCRTEHGLKEIHRERSKSYEIDRVKKYRERSMSYYPNERNAGPIYMQRRSQSVQLEPPSFYRGKVHENHSDIFNPPLEQKERHLIEKGSRRSSREYLEDYHYDTDQSNHRKYLSDGNYSIEYDQQSISREKSVAHRPSDRNHSQKDNRRDRGPSNNLLLRSFRERPMEYYSRDLPNHYEPKSEKVNQRCNGYKYPVKWTFSHSPRRESIRKSSKHSHLLSVPQHHIHSFFETDMELDDDYKTLNSSSSDIYSTFPKEVDEPRQDVYTAEEYQRYNRSRSPKRRGSFEERRERQHSIDNSDVYDRFYNSSVREFLRQSRPEVEEYEGEACSNYRYSHRDTPGKQVIFCKSNSLENLELTRKTYEYLVTSSSNNYMDPTPVNSSEVVHQNQSRKPFEECVSDAENGYENDIFDAIAYLPKGWRSSLGYLAIRIQRCEHSILFTLVGAQGLRHRNHPIAKSVYPRAYAIGCSPPYESNDAYNSTILESTKPYWGIKWKLPLPNDELNGTIFDIYIWDVEFINRAKELQGVASIEIKASNYCDKIQWLPLLESFTDNIDRTPSKPTIVNINGTFIALHLHDIQMRLEESLKRGIAKNTPNNLAFKRISRQQQVTTVSSKRRSISWRQRVLDVFYLVWCPYCWLRTDGYFW